MFNHQNRRKDVTTMAKTIKSFVSYYESRLELYAATYLELR